MRHDLRPLLPRCGRLLWSHRGRPGEAFADPRAERGLHLLNPGAVIRPDLKGLDDPKDLQPFLEPLNAYGDLTGRTNDSTDTRDGRMERIAYALVHHGKGVCGHEQPWRERGGGMVRQQYTPDTRKHVRVTGKPAAHIETGAKGDDAV